MTLYQLNSSSAIGVHDRSYPHITVNVSPDNYLDPTWADDIYTAYIIESYPDLSSILDGRIPHSFAIAKEFPEMEKLIDAANIRIGPRQAVVFNGLVRRNRSKMCTFAVVEAPRINDLRRFAEQTYTAFVGCKKLGFSRVVTKRFGTNPNISDYIQIMSAVLAGMREISIRYVENIDAAPVVKAYYESPRTDVDEATLFSRTRKYLKLHEIDVSHIIPEPYIRAQYIYR